MQVDQLEFYKKLRVKLQMIQEGHLDLHTYEREVYEKIKALSMPVVSERFSPDSEEIEQMAMDIDDFIDDVKQTKRVGTYSKRLRTYLANKLNYYAR